MYTKYSFKKIKLFILIQFFLIKPLNQQTQTQVYTQSCCNLITDVTQQRQLCNCSDSCTSSNDTEYNQIISINDSICYVTQKTVCEWKLNQNGYVLDPNNQYHQYLTRERCTKCTDLHQYGVCQDQRYLNPEQSCQILLNNPNLVRNFQVCEEPLITISNGLDDLNKSLTDKDHTPSDDNVNASGSTHNDDDNSVSVGEQNANEHPNNSVRNTTTYFNSVSESEEDLQHSFVNIYQNISARTYCSPAKCKRRVMRGNIPRDFVFMGNKDKIDSDYGKQQHKNDRIFNDTLQQINNLTGLNYLLESSTLYDINFYNLICGSDLSLLRRKEFSEQVKYKNDLNFVNCPNCNIESALAALGSDVDRSTFVNNFTFLYRKRQCCLAHCRSQVGSEYKEGCVNHIDRRFNFKYHNNEDQLCNIYCDIAQEYPDFKVSDMQRDCNPNDNDCKTYCCKQKCSGPANLESGLNNLRNVVFSRNFKDGRTDPYGNKFESSFCRINQNMTVQLLSRPEYCEAFCVNDGNINGEICGGNNIDFKRSSYLNTKQNCSNNDDCVLLCQRINRNIARCTSDFQFVTVENFCCGNFNSMTTFVKCKEEQCTREECDYKRCVANNPKSICRTIRNDDDSPFKLVTSYDQCRSIYSQNFQISDTGDSYEVKTCDRILDTITRERTDPNNSNAKISETVQQHSEIDHCTVEKCNFFTCEKIMRNLNLCVFDMNSPDYFKFALQNNVCNSYQFNANNGKFDFFYELRKKNVKCDGNQPCQRKYDCCMKVCEQNPLIYSNQKDLCSVEHQFQSKCHVICEKHLTTNCYERNTVICDENKNKSNVECVNNQNKEEVNCSATTDFTNHTCIQEVQINCNRLNSGTLQNNVCRNGDMDVNCQSIIKSKCFDKNQKQVDCEKDCQFSKCVANLNSPNIVPNISPDSTQKICGNDYKLRKNVRQFCDDNQLQVITGQRCIGNGSEVVECLDWTDCCVANCTQLSFENGNYCFNDKNEFVQVQNENKFELCSQICSLPNIESFMQKMPTAQEIRNKLLSSNDLTSCQAQHCQNKHDFDYYCQEDGDYYKLVSKIELCATTKFFQPDDSLIPCRNDDYMSEDDRDKCLEMCHRKSCFKRNPYRMVCERVNDVTRLMNKEEYCTEQYRYFNANERSVSYQSSTHFNYNCYNENAYEVPCESEAQCRSAECYQRILSFEQAATQITPINAYLQTCSYRLNHNEGITRYLGLQRRENLFTTTIQRQHIANYCNDLHNVHNLEKKDRQVFLNCGRQCDDQTCCQTYQNHINRDRCRIPTVETIQLKQSNVFTVEQQTIENCGTSLERTNLHSCKDSHGNLRHCNNFDCRIQECLFKLRLELGYQSEDHVCYDDRTSKSVRFTSQLEMCENFIYGKVDNIDLSKLSDQLIKCDQENCYTKNECLYQGCIKGSFFSGGCRNDNFKTFYNSYKSEKSIRLAFCRDRYKRDNIEFMQCEGKDCTYDDCKTKVCMQKNETLHNACDDDYKLVKNSEKLCRLKVKAEENGTNSHLCGRNKTLPCTQKLCNQKKCLSELISKQYNKQVGNHVCYRQINSKSSNYIFFAKFQSYCQFRSTELEVENYIDNEIVTTEGKTFKESQISESTRFMFDLDQTKCCEKCSLNKENKFTNRDNYCTFDFNFIANSQSDCDYKCPYSSQKVELKCKNDGKVALCQEQQDCSKLQCGPELSIQECLDKISTKSNSPLFYLTSLIFTFVLLF